MGLGWMGHRLLRHSETVARSRTCAAQTATQNHHWAWVVCGSTPSTPPPRLPPPIGRSPLPGMSVRRRTFHSPEQVPAPTLQKLLKPSVYTCLPVPPPAAFRYLRRHTRASKSAMRCGCSFVGARQDAHSHVTALTPGMFPCRNKWLLVPHSPAVASLQVKALATAQKGGQHVGGCFRVPLKSWGICAGCKLPARRLHALTLGWRRTRRRVH